MNERDANKKSTRVAYVSFDVEERSPLLLAVWKLIFDRTHNYTLLELTHAFSAQRILQEVKAYAQEGKNIFVIEEGNMLFARNYRELVSCLMEQRSGFNHVLVATSDPTVMKDLDTEKPRYPELLKPFIVRRDEDGLRTLLTKIREIGAAT